MALGRSAKNTVYNKMGKSKFSSMPKAYNTGTKKGNIAYLQAQAGRDIDRANKMNKPINIAKATVKGIPSAVGNIFKGSKRKGRK